MARYTAQDIVRIVEEQDVRFIRLQFTDILGTVTGWELDRYLLAH